MSVKRCVVCVDDLIVLMVRFVAECCVFAIRSYGVVRCRKCEKGNEKERSDESYEDGSEGEGVDHVILA